MTASALKAAATGTTTQLPTTERPKTIAGLLTDPKIKQQMALALPKHVSADRLARIALTEIRKVPKLAQCDQTSFLGAIMQCAALGLEPGGALGHCYLIPFDNKRQNRTEVQFIVGYRGMIDLARRSGQIVSLSARVVYAKDHFHYRNSHGVWRTMRGQWISAEYIAEYCDEDDEVWPGWYETCVEGDEPGCWPTTPTHYMDLPREPEDA